MDRDVIDAGTSPSPTEPTTPFARGLSEDLLKWLATDAGRSLRAAFAENELDVRIRGDYLNAYRAECSVAKLEWQTRKRRAVIRIHRKYVVDAPLLLTGRERGNYPLIAASLEGVEAYRSSLPEILRAVEDFIGEEGRWEQRCVEANLEGTPLVVIDRQIVNEQPPVKLDVLAVASGCGEPTLVAVELKRDLDNRIQRVAEQAEKYVKMLDPTGGGLRADIAASYSIVCSQLRDLGFKACVPELIQPGMRVVGLVALAAYNERSRLLGRAREAARHLNRPIRFCRLDRDHLTLPPESDWFA